MARGLDNQGIPSRCDAEYATRAARRMNAGIEFSAGLARTSLTDQQLSFSIKNNVQ